MAPACTITRDFLSGNLFDYTPAAGFVGTDSFTVYATDGQGNSNVATVTITVTPPAESIALTDAGNVVSYAGYDHAVLVAALGGDDRVSGTPYNDTLDGGASHDQLFGGAGADELIGGAGTDWLKGDAGNDEISGGAGTDGIRGDTGDDLLDGGAGSDDVRGGDGADIVNGGAGQDRLAGGCGQGRLRVRRRAGPRQRRQDPRLHCPSTTCSGWTDPYSSGWYRPARCSARNSWSASTPSMTATASSTTKRPATCCSMPTGPAAWQPSSSPPSTPARRSPRMILRCSRKSMSPEVSSVSGQRHGKIKGLKQCRAES